MIYLMPESPRYLMKHGKYEKALDAFNQIQTTPLLAARDFMYTHAQLDFESLLLKGRDSEFGNLAERVDVSVQDLPGAVSGPTQFGTRGPSMSQTGTARSHALHAMAQSRSGAHPRDSHQQARHRVGQNENDGMELGVIQRQPSVSTLGIESEIRVAIQESMKENPYSYHIGVTGYFNRLWELWSNMRCRRALLASAVAMITQQMTGVNTIAFLGTVVCM